MRGAMYMFPLHVEEADAEEAEKVHPVPVHALAVPSTAVDPNVIAAAIRNAPTDVVSSRSNKPMEAQVVAQLPLWAQAIVYTGCFAGAGAATNRVVLRSLTSLYYITASDAPQIKAPKRPAPAAMDGEDTPSKRTRSFRKDHLRVMAQEEDGDSTPGSQDTEDECPPRALFTQEERVAENVEKYSDLVGGIVDRLAQRMQSAAFQREEGLDLVTASECKPIMQLLKTMEKADLIRKLDPELLLNLQEMLDRQVQLGQNIDVLGTMSLNNGDEEWRASGIDQRLVARLQCTLDVGICMMVIMATQDIDRRLLAEESMDNCIQLLHHVMTRLVLPTIDASVSSTPMSQDTQVSSPRTPTSTRGRSRASLSASFNVKANKNVRKAMDRIIPVVSDFMDHLAKLVLAVKLADRWVLSFSSTMVGLFALEHSSYSASLQRSGLNVLRSVFIRHPSHRLLVLEETMGVMLKLPTSKRSLRTVKLSHSDKCVQMITTLVVALIQSSVSAHEQPFNDSSAPSGALTAEGAENSNKRTHAPLEEAHESAKLFVKALIKECLKKNEEKDNRVILENFVEDLLVLFVRPEYSGAEVLLEVLSSSLASILNANLTKDAKKLESQYSLTALNQVGKICASIKLYQVSVARDLVDEDSDAKLVIGDHAKFLTELGLKQESKVLDEEDPESRLLVFKHIVIVHMRKNVRTDMTHCDAKRLLLSRFIAHSVANESTSQMESALWKSFWDVGTDTTFKATLPTNELALRLNAHVTVSREFCRAFDRLLAHMMALLSRGIPSFRARVMKALSAIVDIDPMLMAEVSVRTAVNQCFLDEATSVRQAAVDLVGKYVTLQPVLFDRYFEMLAERLHDKGISVRKSVCKIFRCFLSLPPTDSEKDGCSDDDLRRKSACMRSLVERIGQVTEEDIIKNYIIETFQEVWFGSDVSSMNMSSFSFPDEGSDNAPPGWSAVEPGDSTPQAMRSPKDMRSPKGMRSPNGSGKKMEYISPDGKVCRSLEEAWSVYRTPSVTPSSVVRSKRSKMDDTPQLVITVIEVISKTKNMEWLVALLKKLLNYEYSKSDKPARNGKAKDRSDDIGVARARAEKIVSCLIECLLQLEEGSKLKGVTIEDREDQLLSCVKALSAFCEASPLLLSSHLETLMVYLKGDEKLNKANESKLQHQVVTMVNNILSKSERIPDRIVKSLETDLKTLIFRAPPSVVGPSVRCLATLVTNAKRPPDLLFKLLEMFFGYLVKFQDSESLADITPDVNSSLQRALFAAGQIIGAIEMDECEVPVSKLPKLKQGEIVNSLFSMFATYLKKPGNVSCSAKAVQALGFLYMSRPRMLLRAQQDTLMDTMLTSASSEINYQCLVSIKSLLKHEESRLEQGHARQKMDQKKTKKEQVQGDQEADAALIGGVMQAQLKNILALALSKQLQIRAEAVACINILLTQGLVSPLHCVPNLVALETDQVMSVRDMAHAQLIALHEKFPTLINNPAIQGIFLSHSFQIKVFNECSVFAEDKDKKKYCLFGRLYTNCIRSGRNPRNMFLKSLVNQFSDRGSILSGSNVKTKPMKTIDYLCYLTELLSALPYDVEDEPLYIIYLINRYVSLKLGRTMDELKESFGAMGVSQDILESEEDLDILNYKILKDRDTSVKVASAEVKQQQQQCCIAFAISLLIRLKFFLKNLYLLDNEKCQTYQPTNSSKATDQPALLSDRPVPLKLPTPNEMAATDSLEQNWKLFLVVWKAARADQQHLDFDAQEDALAKAKKKKGRRRKSLPARQSSANDEEEEFVEGFN
ncbi:TPA: hypothetical protein N0F65_003884 [Lagenidium giganteum]|uniref:Sister chromatid cohesion protein n=1 Tax=Lagenidium giganteum TaxID=4803 RepID=A0AAV2ZCU9_9STRA|nr:TPA: hypothetical protein N0F65_003884 [Lagenidium giganteum]